LPHGSQTEPAEEPTVRRVDEFGVPARFTARALPGLLDVKAALAGQGSPSGVNATGLDGIRRVGERGSTLPVALRGC